MADPTVLWETDGRGVATVTLNWPEVNNAYNGDLIAGLHATLDDLGARPGVRVVVRGNGRHFQAGVDLRWSDEVAAASPAENLRASRLTADATRRRERLSVPTIALVQSGCFGGGTGFVAACDVAIAPVADLAAGARRADHVLRNAPDATAQTKAVALESAWGAVTDETYERLLVQHAARRQSPETVEGRASFALRQAHEREGRDPGAVGMALDGDGRVYITTIAAPGLRAWRRLSRHDPHSAPADEPRVRWRRQADALRHRARRRLSSPHAVAGAGPRRQVDGWAPASSSRSARAPGSANGEVRAILGRLQTPSQGESPWPRS